MTERGTAAESDLQNVRAERLNAVQKATELASQKQMLLRMLSTFCGIEVNNIQKPQMKAEDGGLMADNHRPELKALDAQIGVLNAQEKALNAALMPKVGLFAQGYYGYPGLNMFEDMMRHKWSLNGIVGARVTWNIGAFYTRKNDKAKLQLQRDMTENNREVFLFNNNLEQIQQHENIARYQKLMAQDGEIISKKIYVLTGVALMMTACGNNEKEYDATGTFEATETTVFAEQSGTLLSFDVEEGDKIEAARQVGLIDTTQTWLKIQQMDATKAVYQSQKPDMERQIAATRQQLAKAQQDEQRYRELVADGAAPSKMFDDATSQVKVLQKQLDAQISSLSTSTQALDKQTATAEVQKAQLKDMLRKCHILTPIKGIVLEKYVEQGEFVSVGKPLFKIADTESMKLRAYVTSAQLQNIKIGQKVKVFADYGDGQRKEYAGTISWISSRSEFTPKTILTDDERADLVYAVKVAIKNDGFVKIGMYGEVKF